MIYFWGKLRNDLWCCKLSHIYAYFFCHYHVIEANKEIPSLFGHCHVILPFLVGLYKKLWNFVFQVHLFGKQFNSRMAAVMLQVMPSFYPNYSKNSLFIPANTYEKYIVSKEHCIAHQYDKKCFLPNCTYHITLMGDIEELLKKMDSFCFTNQHVDCF